MLLGAGLMHQRCTFDAESRALNCLAIHCRWCADPFAWPQGWRVPIEKKIGADWGRLLFWELFGNFLRLGPLKTKPEIGLEPTTY